MNPNVLGVIRPGFLNQVPTLEHGGRSHQLLIFPIDSIEVLDSNVGVLILRIGFWLLLNTTIVEYTPKPSSNYSGPDIISPSLSSYTARFCIGVCALTSDPLSSRLHLEFRN